MKLENLQNDFLGTSWKHEIDVRDFIQHNYEPYDGDESFLEGPSEKTKKLWDKLTEMFKVEREKGVYDAETVIPQSIDAYGAGYIDKENEVIVGLQTDAPLKRGIFPRGGIRMVEAALKAYGYELDPLTKKIYTKYRKTHNEGVFSAYNDDIKAALASGKVASYVIDFPDDEVLDVAGIIAIPHLGASTPESEDNCAMMAVDEVRNYLENGSIIHSVNYPDIDAGAVAAKRVCVLHKNVPNVLTKLSAIISNEGLNIENMLSKSKGDYAYSILDFAGDISDAAKDAFNEVEGVIRVRFLG